MLRSLGTGTHEILDIQTVLGCREFTAGLSLLACKETRAEWFPSSLAPRHCWELQKS